MRRDDIHPPGDAYSSIQCSLKVVHRHEHIVRGALAGLPLRGSQRHVYLAGHSGGVAEVSILSVSGVDFNQNRLYI
jgi:hypothetical protein